MVRRRGTPLGNPRQWLSTKISGWYHVRMGLIRMPKQHWMLERLAECRRQRDEEERRQRVMVITEFDAGDPEATMHAMAAEILRYRHCVRQLADAIGWTNARAPFVVMPPGRDWRPRRTPEVPDVPPHAA